MLNRKCVNYLPLYPARHIGWGTYQNTSTRDEQYLVGLHTKIAGINSQILYIPESSVMVIQSL